MSSPEILNPATAQTMLSPESWTNTYALGACAAALFVLACAFYPSSLLRWFQRKRYQYEVTFSLYMLTPTEKFVFNSVLFLFLSMVTIAVCLYLPRHIVVIARRVCYYLGYDLESAGRFPEDVVKSGVAAVKATSASLVRDAVETANDYVSEL